MIVDVNLLNPATRSMPGRICMKQLVATNENYNNFSSDKSRSFPNLAILKDDGSIFCYTGGGWKRTGAEPANAIAVALGGAGLFCLDSAGTIYHWNNRPDHSQWSKDSGLSGVSGISCDPEGSLWATTRNGEIHTRPAKFVGLGSATGRLFELQPWQKAAMAVPAAVIAAPAPTTPPNGTWTYMIKKGDTLNEIVKAQYKVQGKKVIEGLVAEIVKLNKLPDADTIKAGDSLSMPAIK
jgi:hypothetical protein